VDECGDAFGWVDGKNQFDPRDYSPDEYSYQRMGWPFEEP
jgi:hypothetical protein